jgi:MbtH protein
MPTAAEREADMSDEREGTYMAIVNDEDQYSIWPTNRELPLGWREAGKQGPRDEVLAWIKEVWTDMQRPASRIRMGENEREQD